MKRYIRCSIDNHLFDTTTTNTSYYDDFLNPECLAYKQKAKNLTGHIEYMTPAEYFEECASTIFKGRHSVEDLKRQRAFTHGKDHNKLVDTYREAMRNGDKFPLCYLNYADLGQEGLHRMYAAGELLGWNTKFPVLIVEPYDIDRWNESNFRQEIADYERYVLKYVIREAVDEISDWNNPVPDNFEESFKDLIEEKASEYEDDPEDIEVSIKVENNMVFVFLVGYQGHEIESSTYSEKLWLDDMFKMTDDTDLDIDEMVIDDIDYYK